MHMGMNMPILKATLIPAPYAFSPPLLCICTLLHKRPWHQWVQYWQGIKGLAGPSTLITKSNKFLQFLD